MTRSLLSPHGPELAKKQFRADAKARGVTFREAAEARNLLKPKPSVAPGMGRRTHGRMGQIRWNGRVFMDVEHEVLEKPVCGDGGGICETCLHPYPPYMLGNDGEAREPPTPVLNSLLDIAKPAKPKGIAKEFEVVDSVTRIIALEDEGPSKSSSQDDEFWEDWDEVYDDCKPVEGKKALYSTIVESRTPPDP